MVNRRIANAHTPLQLHPSLHSSRLDDDPKKPPQNIDTSRAENLDPNLLKVPQKSAPKQHLNWFIFFAGLTCASDPTQRIEEFESCLVFNASCSQSLHWTGGPLQ